MASQRRSGKRQRELELTVADLMLVARRLWQKSNPHVRSTAQEEDRKFRDHFGCGPLVAHAAWKMLVDHDLLPDGGTLEHFLWTLQFLKAYGKLSSLCQLCGCDAKTLTKWVWQFIHALSELEPHMVSIEDTAILAMERSCMI